MTFQIVCPFCGTRWNWPGSRVPTLEQLAECFERHAKGGGKCLGGMVRGYLAHRMSEIVVEVSPNLLALPKKEHAALHEYGLRRAKGNP